MGKIISSLFGGGRGDNGAAAQQEAAMAEASRAAAETARQTEASRQAAQRAQQDMEANFRADLSGDNKATVVAGGSADALGAATDSTKRKRAVGGLASTLGLNV